MEFGDFIYSKGGNATPHMKGVYKEAYKKTKNYKQQHNYVIFDENALEIIE